MHVFRFYHFTLKFDDNENLSERKNHENVGGVSGMASWECFIIAVCENIWQEHLIEKTNLI